MDDQSAVQIQSHVRASETDSQACRRCRQQKLRCSRDKPACRRCQKSSTACVYPPPPDRKLLASQRLKKVRARVRERSKDPEQLSRTSATSFDHVYGDRSPAAPTVSGNLHPFHQAQGNGSPTNGEQSTLQELSGSSTSVKLALRSPTMPSPEVATFLIEIFFTRVYNAMLLFHKESFQSDYAAGKVPNFVSMSIFALASIFLRNVSKRPNQDDKEVELGISTLSVPDFSNYSHDWATSATQQVMMQADEPRLDTVRACQILCLYWFAQDQKHKTHILTHLAYTTCRLLGYHVPPRNDTEMKSLESEVNRRCYWSCWITGCISQGNSSFKTESWNGVIGLPFPSDDASFIAGKPILKEVFNKSGNVVSIDGSDLSHQQSMWGEFVKLYGLWWEIQHFVRHHHGRKSNDSSDRIQILLALDRRLELIFENFHPDFQYHGPTSFTAVKIDAYKLFSLHCLYRLCGCVLHSCIVPLFSGSPIDPEIPQKYLRMCAEEAVKHSKITLNMAMAFLRIRPDKSRLTSLLGYAMFVSSSIQLRCLNAQEKLHIAQIHNLKAAVSILEQLKEYWRPLQGLWAQLRAMFDLAELNINDLLSDHNHSQTSLPDPQTDFERIMSHKPQSNTVADIYTYVPDQEKTAHQLVSNTESRPRRPVSVDVSIQRNEMTDDRLLRRASYSQILSYSRQHSRSNILGHNQSTQRSTRYIPLNSVLNSIEPPNFPPQQPQPQSQSQSQPTNINPPSQTSRQMSQNGHLIEGFEGMPITMGMDLSQDREMFGEAEGGSWWTRSITGMEEMEGVGKDPLEVLLEEYLPSYI